MLRIGSVVLNVSDVAGAVRFWMAALDYEPRYAVAADWAILRPRTASGPNLSLNLGETRPDAVPHIHLDLYADDQALRGEASAAAWRPTRRGLALPGRAARLRGARGPGRQPVLRHRHHRPLGGAAVTPQPGPTNTLTDVAGPAGRARDPHRARAG